ncbi:MAG TPA: porin family protein [Sphingobium sp.]|nr:porin family protein [Sphingobium sp.]
MKSPILTFTGALLATGLIAAIPAQAEPFNGPSVGVQAGWSENRIGHLDNDLGVVPVDRSRDSFTGGVYAGYDYKLGSNIVIGAEAAFNIAAKDRIVTHGAVDTIFNPRHAFDLSARAGYLVNDKSLLYVRGGYDNLLARTTLIDDAGAVSSKESYDGWMIGGGFERALGDKLSTRLEYRYSDLGGGASKFDRHQVLLGVAYHF